MKFTLTTEEDLNEGLGSLFVYLAILWSLNEYFGINNWIEWIIYYIIYKILVGTFIGVTICFLYRLFISKLSVKKEKNIHVEFVAIALTLIVYSIAGMIIDYFLPRCLRNWFGVLFNLCI